MAALEADLHDIAGLPRSSDHGKTLPDIIGQGFFAENVEPLFAGGDELKGMPLRRGGYENSFKTFDSEEIAVVLEFPRSFALHFFQFRGVPAQVFRICVTDAEYLHSPYLEGGFHKCHAVAARSDQPGFQRVVGSPDRKMNARCQGSRTHCGFFNKLPPVHRMINLLYLNI